MIGLEWADLGVALGLALAIEGAAYALAPDLIRRLYATLLMEPVPRLRIMGAIALALGVLIVWVIRG
jgi:uncharacterized protein YjeT (DUF2065 family)